MPTPEIQLPPADRAELVELWSQGLPLAQVVERMGYGRVVIRRVIREMGLTRPHAADWTPAEDAIIRAFAMIRTADQLLPLLPGRSRQAIRNRADRMGVKLARSPSPAWTEEEDAIIRSRYGREIVAEWAFLLRGRTVNAIIKRARQLGIRSGLSWPAGAARKSLGQNETAKRLREPPPRLDPPTPTISTVHRPAPSLGLMTAEA